MFHIVEQVPGVFEVWFVCDEFDYVWSFVGEFDSRDGAEDEVSALMSFV